MRAGSDVSLASPFVSIQISPWRGTTRTMRWVKTTSSGPTRMDTTSPTASAAASTGVVTTSAPMGIAGAIEGPRTTRVVGPSMGRIRPKKTPARAAATRSTSARSSTRRSPRFALARTFIPSCALGAAGRLRVVGGLLGVEGERGGRRRVLVRVPRGGGEAPQEAEVLGHTRRQRAVAGLAALRRVAERGTAQGSCPVESRSGTRARPRLDRQLELVAQALAVRVRGGGRHGIAQCAGPAVGDGQRGAAGVAREGGRDREQRRRADGDVDRPRRERAGRVRADRLVHRVQASLPRRWIRRGYRDPQCVVWRGCTPQTTWCATGLEGYRGWYFRSRRPTCRSPPGPRMDVAGVEPRLDGAARPGRRDGSGGDQGREGDNFEPGPRPDPPIVGDEDRGSRLSCRR